MKLHDYINKHMETLKNSNPRIALIHPYMDVRGGAERKLLVFYTQLNQEFPQNKLFLCRYDKAKTFSNLIHNDSKFKVLPSGSKLVWTIKVFWQLLFYKPHFIFVSNYPANLPAGLFSKLFSKTKVLWLCNEVGPSFNPKTSLPWKIYYWIEKKLSSGFDQYIGNSDFTSSEINRYYGVPAKTIRSGIEIKKTILNEEVRESIKGWSDKKFFFSLQRIEKHKNIEFLLKIAEKYPEENFLVAGMGTDADYFKKISLNYKNIYYLGGITEDEKYFLYRHAIAFLFLPREEPLGVTVMESLSQNTPVVAFNKGGPKETVLDQKNGILADSDSDYIEAINKILLFSRLDPEFGEKYIFENFTNEIMVKRFLTEVRSVLNHH